MSTSMRAQYPSLDPTWADEVMRELLIRGARGPVVGDTLATADEHCRFSGESPLEAFGPARTYAHQVPLTKAEREDHSPRTQVRAAGPSVLGVAGMLLAFATLDAWRAGTGVAVTWSMLLGLVLSVAVAVVLVVVKPEWILRRAWVGAVVLTLAVSLFVGLALLRLPVLLHLPVAPAAVLAAALLAAGVIWSRADGEPAQPVSHPTQGDPSPRITRALEVAAPWFFVALTLLGFALLSVLPAGSSA